MNNYCIVLTTYASPEVGTKLIDKLLEAKLAACIQSLPIQSAYVWESKVNREPETLMLIKAKAEDYEAIEACIKENHDYTTPEIIKIPISAGSTEYLGWISAVTSR